MFGDPIRSLKESHDYAKMVQNPKDQSNSIEKKKIKSNIMKEL